jgi:diguanylate cyclase (GGDEF)-like protein/PAS domain S-box-containing protein
MMSWVHLGKVDYDSHHYQTSDCVRLHKIRMRALDQNTFMSYASFYRAAGGPVRACIALRRVMAGLLSLALIIFLVPVHAEALKVRVGVYQNSPKIFTDQNGKASGILIDILRQIAEKENWDLSFTTCEWAACLDLLQHGKIDLMPDVAYSAERARHFDFHQTPALYSWSQVYRNSNVSITSPLDLNNKRVALLGGGIQADGFETMVRGFGLKVKIIPTTSLDEAFRLVQQGRADAAVANHYFGEFHAQAHHLVETPVVFQPSRLFYATARGRNSELLAEIDRNLSAWEKDPASPYYAIIKRWGGEVQPTFVPPYVWRILLTVTALMLAFLLGAVILRRQVRLKTRQLAERTEYLQATMDAIPDLMFELDIDGRFYDYHAHRSDLLAAPKEAFIGKTLAEVMPPDVADIGMQALHEASRSGWSGGQQYELQLPQGRFWFELSVARKQADDAQPERFIVLSHDITARKSAEEKIQRLTKLYAALSQCNQAIVRCADETELFPQICQEAVTFGGMKMAWIGMLDEADGLLKPVAAFGTGTEYLDGIVISIEGDQVTGHGPSGTSVRENRPVWCQDFARDPSTAPWHERGAKFGWASSASLPLHRKGVVVGALTLYSGEVHAFDEAEQNLLVEMAMDISFALDRFEDEARRNRLEDSLSMLSFAVEQSPNSIVITDLDANIVYANAAFSKQTGYSMHEVVGKNPKAMSSGKTSREIYDDMWEHLRQGKTWKGELINCHKDGKEYIESVMISPVRDHNGKVTSYLEITEDITEKKQAEERIQHLAHFDQLTGLPNRTLLQEHFKYALSLAQRSGKNLAVMFLDLDHFKNINDTLGHTLGDQFLMEVSERLKSALREEDTVSRLGGDEFIFILPGTDENGAAHVAGKLLDVFAESYLIGQHELLATPSIGIAIYPEDGRDMEALLKNADAAMYQVKQAGRNNFRFFTQEMQAHSARNLRISNALRHALARNELYVHYQPQISILDGSVIGAEALLRWQHPELGIISPAEFIPIAEASGQIIPIGEWVLRTAMQQLRSWMDKGLPEMNMAVNLSVVQFRHANLPEVVSGIVAEAGLPPGHLELELTEAVAMDDPLLAMAVMDKLYKYGIRMSIDDFGTGYSSLSYLKQFKVYKLKIDQSFVHDLTDDPDDKAIVTAIINMASSLGMHTIAEGVETAGQLAFLRMSGCEEAQGYYFSKPLSADEFENFVRNYS